MLVSPHVGVLHHVFRFRIITQNGPGDAIETLVVAAHDQLEQRRLALQYAADHFLIWESFRVVQEIENSRAHFEYLSNRGRSRQKVTDIPDAGSGLEL